VASTRDGGAGGLGRAEPRPGRDPDPGGAEDRADGAVGCCPGDAGQDQGAVRRGRHRDPELAVDVPPVRGGRQVGRDDANAPGPAVSEVAFYDAIGGHRTIKLIVDRFYEGVAGDDLLREMYPEQDLGPAARRLRMFLEQYWGGP